MSLLHLERFSIVFSARTGSSYLREALNNHPLITCSNESAIPKTPIVPHRFDFSHPDPDEGNVLTGLKIPSQLINRIGEKHPFWTDLVWNNPIILCTRNSLHSFISVQLVKANENKFAYVPYTKPAIISVKKAEKYISRIERLNQHFLNRERVLVVRYEDGVEEMCKQAFDFLEVGRVKPVSGLKKQRSLPLNKLILNYDELASSSVGHLL